MANRMVRAASLIVLLILILSGCYGRRLYDIESRLDDLDSNIGAIEDSLTQVAYGVAHLDSTVGDESAPIRTSRARIQSRMDDTQTRLEILEALVKENRYKISQLSMLRGPRPAARDTARTPQDTSTLEASVARHIYETAYVDFVKGNFQSAIIGFRDFVKRFPMTDFSDDAQFMVAQSFFVLGEYPDAIGEFRKVLDDHPSGDRVPEAMYKLGLCYLKIEDVETAREYFKILVNRYPTAVETKQAQTMLDSLPPPEDTGD
jgi:tol-pal system protein YbgF